MLDPYSKVVLTVIAAALAVLAYDKLAPQGAEAQNLTARQAQYLLPGANDGSCGTNPAQPCYVELVPLPCGAPSDPCYMNFKRSLTSPGLPVTVVPNY